MKIENFNIPFHTRRRKKKRTGKKEYKMGFDSRLNESLITGTTGVISSSTILRKRRVIRWQVGLEKQCSMFSSEFITNLIRDIVGFLRFNNVNYWPVHTRFPYFSIVHLLIKINEMKGKKYWPNAIKPSINWIKKHRCARTCFFFIDEVYSIRW